MEIFRPSKKYSSHNSPNPLISWDIPRIFPASSYSWNIPYILRILFYFYGIFPYNSTEHLRILFRKIYGLFSTLRNVYVSFTELFRTAFRNFYGYFSVYVTDSFRLYGTFTDCFTELFRTVLRNFYGYFSVRFTDCFPPYGTFTYHFTELFRTILRNIYGVPPLLRIVYGHFSGKLTEIFTEKVRTKTDRFLASYAFCVTKYDLLGDSSPNTPSLYGTVRNNYGLSVTVPDYCIR